MGITVRVGIGERIGVEMESGNSQRQNTTPVNLQDRKIICWQFSSQDRVYEIPYNGVASVGGDLVADDRGDLGIGEFVSTGFGLIPSGYETIVFLHVSRLD